MQEECGEGLRRGKKKNAVKEEEAMKQIHRVEVEREVEI
jgi:hypothetical protein